MSTHATFAKAPQALPLLGHVVPLLRDPLRFLCALPGYGDLVEVRIGPVKVIVLCDPDLTNYVLRNDRVFDKGGFLYERIREVIGTGMAASLHDVHRRQRRLTQPAFRRSRMPGYARVMTEQAVAITEAWQDGQVIDAVAEMVMLNARIDIITMFASTLPPEEIDRTVEDLGVVFAGMYWRAFLPRMVDRIPLPRIRHYDRAFARLQHTIRRIIDEHRADGIDHGDLLSTLLAAHDEATASTLSDVEVADQVMLFFLAGVETAAITLAWALHVVATHPDIERRLHEEVDAVLGGDPATLEDLPKLDVTGRVIRETLRCHSPTWMLTRATTTDTELAGYPIAAGTNIAYSQYIIHHRADLYPDPDRFDPDRWLEENAKQIPRSAVIPFGAGPRRCIGEDIGITKATIALATITSRWRLDLLPGQRVRPIPSIIMKPDGLRLRLSPGQTSVRAG
jgi:cytochrome P450